MSDSLTQTIRFEVVAPKSLRRNDWIAIQHKLWNLSDTFVQAANKAISALWLLRQGAIEHPKEAPKRGPDKGGEPRPVPEQTLVYRCMNGTWDPVGAGPAYQPYRTEKKIKVGKKSVEISLPGPSGNALAALSGKVMDRFRTDYIDIVRGNKSLATFRNGGIPVSNQGVKFADDGTIRISAFGSFEGLPAVKRGAGWVPLAPNRLDKSRRTILDRIRQGQYKLGGCELSWQKRGRGKGKWFLSISYTDKGHVVRTLEDAPTKHDVIYAGIDTGIRHSGWIAYTDASGVPLKRPDVFQWPKSLLRALAGIDEERKLVGLLNRADLGIREGRGRSRKIRPLKRVEDKHARLVENAVREQAALFIKAVRSRAEKEGSVPVLALEDHKDWSIQSLLNRTDKFSRSKAAYLRRNFFRWHEGALREQILWVARREGILAFAVDPAWTSRTCHACGLIHKQDWSRVSVPADSEVPSGRVSYEHFFCTEGATQPLYEWEGGVWGDWDGKSWTRNDIVKADRAPCGYSGQADHNAAINIARLGRIKAL